MEYRAEINKAPKSYDPPLASMFVLNEYLGFAVLLNYINRFTLS